MRRHSWIGIAAGLLLPGLALGEEGLSSAARQQAAQGAAALSAGDMARAQARYEQAYQAQPAPRLLRELGRVAQAQGQTVEAADLYRRYLAESMAEASTEAEREELQRLVRALTAPTGEVGVQGEDGALVRVDGRLVGALPLSVPLLLSEGTHRVRIERDRRKAETQLKVAPSRPVSVRFTLVPPVALVSPTRAAVLLADWGGLAEADRGRLRRATGQGAMGERVLIIPEERVAAARAGKGPCGDDIACQEGLAATFQAHYVLALQAAAVPETRGLRLSLRVLDVAAGPAGVFEETCAACGGDKGERALAGLIGRALREVETRARGELELTSQPPAAAAQVDGRAVGVTPQRRAAFAGEHEVLLTLAGYKPYQTRVTLGNDQVAQVSAPLQKIPPPPVTRPVVVAKAVPVAAKPTPVWRKWWFWGGLGLIAAGAVAGGVAGALVSQSQGDRMFQNPRFLSF